MALYNNVIRSMDREDPPDEGKLGYEFWNAVEELPIIKQIKDWNEDAAQKSEYWNERARSGKQGLLIQGLQAVEDTLGTVVGLPFKALEAGIQEVSDRTNIDARTFGAIKDIYSYGKSVKASKSGSFYKGVQVAKKNIPRADILNPGQITVKPITTKQAEQAIDKVQGLSRFRTVPSETITGPFPDWRSQNVPFGQTSSNITDEAYDAAQRTDAQYSDDSDDLTWTNRDGESYSLEGIDNNRASEELTNWSNREASDWGSIQGLRAAGLSYDEIYTQYPELARRFTGTTPLNELIEIAEENNIPFNKVYEYKKEQDVNFRNLTLLTNAFNIIDNNQLQVNATYALRKAVQEGLIPSSIVNEYNQIINKAKRNQGKFHSIGHLQSLKEMWSKGLRGGNRSTNLISEPFINFLAEVEPGLWKELQGNAARQNTQDWQQYSLERLTDYNVDIQEDFIRFAHPELGIIGDLQESGLSRRVASEFQGIAALQFNYLRSEIIDEVNKMSEHPVYSKEHIIKELERALTTSIADFYIENASELSGSNLGGWKLKALITAPDGFVPRLETEISKLGSEFKNILTNSDLDNPASLSKFVRLLRRVTE